jgi:hypothetical protein
MAGAASRAAAGTTLATTRDRIVAVSGDAELHTLRLLRDGQSVLNVPLPPQSQPAPLAVSDPGTYEWSCGVHAAERGTLVVVDHPYATSTDANGTFGLRDVPPGAAVVVVVRGGRAVARREATAPDSNIEITLETEKK